MNADVYWIWLQQALGYGSRRVADILSLYLNAREFYLAGMREWRLCGCFSQKELDRLEQTTLQQAQSILDACHRQQDWVLTLEHPDYPLLLRQIDNPPCVLYGKGELPATKYHVAIVGTRSATPYGLDVAFQLGYGLAKAGVSVVSGGALGIDSASHKGAVQAGGKTVAVLGCGLHTNYLRENASLRNAIAHSGALITEYPLDTPANSWNFPMRNRIISGLAQGTLVVEAGKKSGSLITANLALEQGRDVFAVPGNVNSSVSTGANHLIQAGAKPVTCVEDLLEEYEIPYAPQALQKAAVKMVQFEELPELSHRHNKDKQKDSVHARKEISHSPLSVSLSEEGAALYQALQARPLLLEELSHAANLKIQQALTAATELELYGLIQACSGGRYCAI